MPPFNFAVFRDLILIFSLLGADDVMKAFHLLMKIY